jgi:hypothetical protein
MTKAVRTMSARNDLRTRAPLFTKLVRHRARAPVGHRAVPVVVARDDLVLVEGFKTE